MSKKIRISSKRGNWKKTKKDDTGTYGNSSVPMMSRGGLPRRKSLGYNHIRNSPRGAPPKYLSGEVDALSVSQELVSQKATFSKTNKGGPRRRGVAPEKYSRTIA